MEQEVNEDGFVIDEKLREYMPDTDMLCDQDLEKSLLATNGARDALLVARLPDGKQVLYDGHRRYRLCKKHNLDFFIEVRDVRDYEEIYKLMDQIQTSRRNLSINQVSLVRGRVHPKAHEGFTQATKRQAKEAGISLRQLYRDREYVAAVDRLAPAIKEEVIENWDKKATIALGKLSHHEQVDTVKRGDKPKPKRKSPTQMLKGSFEERKAITERLVVDVQNALADVDEAKPDIDCLREAKQHARSINRVLDKWGQNTIEGTS